MRYVLLTRFPEGVNDQWQVQMVSDDLERVTRVQDHAEKNGMIASICDTEA